MLHTAFEAALQELVAPRLQVHGYAYVRKAASADDELLGFCKSLDDDARLSFSFSGGNLPGMIVSRSI